MRGISFSLFSVAVLVALFVAPEIASAQNYVWPLSNSTTPDEMNTSFGPRSNFSMWDFHDGLDLPAVLGTPVYAVRQGTVHHAGDANTGGYSSRHVILKVTDPTDGVLYVPYLHLDSIAPGIASGAAVNQGTMLGTVGQDNASYPHLHIEFRKGTSYEISSVHPLHYLPYTSTSNFTSPMVDRFNRMGAGNLLTARLLFGANSKLEGDLIKVEVDLKNGSTLLSTRVVNFDDKTTINEGNGDQYTYVNEIGVEGYQSSNMVAAGNTDLKYGILVRSLPSNCDTLVARVIDLAGNVITSAVIPVPQSQIAFNQNIGFEDGAMPPASWSSVTNTGTSVQNSKSAFYAGKRGMISKDTSTTNTAQSASIAITAATGRFEWSAEAWFKPTQWSLGDGKDIYILHFLNGTNLSVAARVRYASGQFLAGISYTKPDGTTGGKSSIATLAINIWRKWKLQLLRIGTRETTAVLYLDDVEQIRVSWDAIPYEPLNFRAGIGRSAPTATATFFVDEIRLMENTMPNFTNPVLASKMGNTFHSHTEASTHLQISHDAGVIRFIANEPKVTELGLQVFDVAGRLVFQSQEKSNQIMWRGQNFAGQSLANGVYLYLVTMHTGDGQLQLSALKKLILKR